jgi:hypothetical protein
MLRFQHLMVGAVLALGIVMNSVEGLMPLLAMELMAS